MLEKSLLNNIINTPYANNNPYHRLIYGLQGSNEKIQIGRKDFQDLQAFGQTRKNPILHLHWDDRIFGRGDDHETNMSVARNYIEEVSSFKQRGGKILWTIHNREPHNLIDRETFLWGRKQLAPLSDIIHVHALHAARHMIEDWDVAPEKIRIIRHPSYLGAYEDAATTLARQLPQTKNRQFLFFGMMRWAKGLSTLRDAIGRLSNHTNAYSVEMVGSIQPRFLRRLNSLSDNPNVILRPGRASDKELQEVFARSQIFLAPFDNVFTSGSVMLAQTFGLPVIGLDTPEMRELTPKGCHDLLYSEQRPKPIVQMMKRMIAMPDSELQERRQICFDFSQHLSPERMSSFMGMTLSSLESDA